jgi:hypothetical protein
LNPPRAGFAVAFGDPCLGTDSRLDGRLRRALGALVGLSILAVVQSPSSALAQSATADFAGQTASVAVRQVADWVVRSGDNAKLPFVIVDKTQARVFVFDVHGHLSGASSALVGLAKGDDIVPGIGDKPLSAISPRERITPAGRFVAVIGNDLEQDILWVDYGAALSLHRVVKGSPKEHRAQRLASASPLDRRISYGCINVPSSFYETLVSPVFTKAGGIVYILPETRPLAAVFAKYGFDGKGAAGAR